MAALRKILLFIIITLSALPVFSQSVKVYTYADPSMFGRSLNRSAVTSVPLAAFRERDTLRAGGDGFLTAVLVEMKVYNALEQLLDGKQFVTIDESIIQLEETPGGGRAYRLMLSEWDLNMKFSLEQVSQDVLKVIEDVYSENAFLLGELKREYSDGYIVRIHEAEDVVGAADGRLSYLEALAGASLIGKVFQPLLGIHDGLGLLDDIGMAVVTQRLETHSDFINYRRFTEGSDEIYSFLYTVRSMGGDFVDNLYRYVKDEVRMQPEDGMIMLPEEFFLQEKGDNTDFALFFYDILRRAGYDVHFVLIDPAGADEKLHAAVFFRETGTELWAIVDSRELKREIPVKWSRLPSLLYEETVDFYEPDISRVLSERKFVLPPPSAWKVSRY